MNPQKKAPPPALEKPRQPGRIRAVFLAVMVHAAFFALIVFGVTWQSRPDTPVQAEIWDKLPPAPSRATPREEPKRPQPEPAKEEPKPEPPKPEPPKPEPPKPEPARPPPKPPEEKPEPPKPDPAIAKKLEREKLEKEKKERIEHEKAQKQKEEEAKKKREKEDLDKKKREEDKRRKDEETAKAESDKARAQAVAAQKSEIDKFINDIKNKIRGKANVPDTVTGNPEVQVRIRVLPGGEVLDIAITKRSGNPTYDAAIERGIRSASPLPVPAPNSELFPQFRDLTLNFRHER
ncbi:MAG: energy transducer TonB [Usitatibacter sp.]